MTDDNQTENTISEVKNAFNEYFSAIGGKKFKQFYYDWHIDNMLTPFAGVVEYFHRQYQNDAPQKFHEFVEDITAQIKIYNADKPQLSVLKNSSFSKDGHSELSALVDGIETFGFEYRQFMYNFADNRDHSTAFAGWPIKTNMPYSALYGMMIASDILKMLDKNYNAITKDNNNVYQRSLYAADTFLRDKQTPAYQYDGSYNFHSRQQIMGQMRDLRDRLSDVVSNNPNLSPKLKDMFQIETKGTPSSKGYWPCGFELEFYVPEEYKDYGKLISYLKEQNGWDKIYSSNKDASVYQDSSSAGVIMRDESLVRYNGLAAVEYASRVMKSKEDEESCLKILDSFDQGHVNVHCSLHQHLASDTFDLDVYKRLVKRMMQHEAEIVSAFAAPERQDNRLLYATYIGRNLSPNNQRDYPFMCVMTDICDSKEELREFASFGHKYKTLNIMPEHTVEMRFMNANFNKNFVRAFLAFNRDFVQSAVENSPQHINRCVLNKYSWYNNQQTDDKTAQHYLPYYYQCEYDSFSPIAKPVSKESIEQEQKYALLVTHALTETGKIPYVNAAFKKSYMEAKKYAR